MAPAWAKMGVLNNCDFQINQIPIPPEDFQFYTDWPNPASWITCQGIPISAHPATRHFWLFMQIGSGQVDRTMASTSLLRGELELLISNADAYNDPDFRIQQTENLLDSFQQDVVGKGDYYEIIVLYDRHRPCPNPAANFSRAYPMATYFYLLMVYNSEIRQATDFIWSDFQVSVFLSSFTATAGKGQVVLEWITDSERQNLGFHLHRRNSPTDPFVTINRALIPSAGQGNSEMRLHYRFVDRRVLPGLTYEYQLEDVNFRGESTLHGMITASLLDAGVEPEKFHLFQNHPNPFNAGTEIRYRISQDAHAIISIYDVRGALVTVLANEFQGKGEYMVSWDGQNVRDHIASSGLYFCALRIGQDQQVRKMILLR